MIKNKDKKQRINVGKIVTMQNKTWKDNKDEKAWTWGHPLYRTDNRGSTREQQEGQPINCWREIAE